MNPNISVDNERLETFCRDNGILRLALFGSVLRADFRPDSDVDVLVVFEPDREPGFLRLSAMERELSGIFGRHVDLRTQEDLSRLFREEVVASSKVLYAA